MEDFQYPRQSQHGGGSCNQYLRILHGTVRHNPDEVEAVAMEILARAVRDEHPRVRLEAIRGLGKLNTAEAASVAL